MVHKAPSSDKTLSLPIFPKFEPLRLDFKPLVEAITFAYEPYSDFNFTNLWAWDLDGSTLVTTLNNNLVFRLTDYEKNIRFYTFIGNEKLGVTAKELVQYAASMSDYQELMLVPEVVALGISDKSLQVKEDPDNHDYMLDVDSLALLKASNFRGKRNLLNRFNKLYGAKTKIKNINLVDSEFSDRILKLFLEWQLAREKDDAEVHDELTATTRMLSHPKEFSLKALLVFADDRLVGCTIYEIMQGKTAIIHVDKADTSYTGIFEFMKQGLAEHLVSLGVRYINYEQDLGIEGLRKSKLSYKPVRMLKKYTISL